MSNLLLLMVADNAAIHARSHYGLASAIQMLASIHAGVPGASIPREVMDFYKAMKGGDASRPKILKQVVLTLEGQITSGFTDQHSLEAAVRTQLEIVAARLSERRLEEWLLADLRREFLIPCAATHWGDCLRVGYVAEGMEMLDDTISYATALAHQAQRRNR